MKKFILTIFLGFLFLCSCTSKPRQAPQISSTASSPETPVVKTADEASGPTVEISSLLEERKLEEAFEKIGEMERQSEPDPSFYSLRGRYYMLKRDFRRAEDDFEKALRETPDKAQNYINRGFVYYYTGRREEALKDFKRADELEPDNPQSLFGKGLIRLDEGEREKALDLFKNSAKQSRKEGDKKAEARTLVMRAYALIKSEERLNEAEKDLRRALELEPDKASTYCSLAEIYYLKYEPEKSLEYLNRAIEMDPNLDRDPDFAAPGNVTNPYADRGALHIQLEEWEKAEKDLTRAIDFHPKRLTIYEARSQAYENMGKRKEADEDARTLLQLLGDRTDFQANRYRSLAWRILRDYDKALKYVNITIKEKPDFTDLYLDRAIILIEMGKVKEARKDALFVKEKGNPRDRPIAERILRY